MASFFYPERNECKNINSKTFKTYLKYKNYIYIYNENGRSHKNSSNIFSLSILRKY